MILHRGYRYRIYPTSDQAARLLAWEDALRWLWNLALEQRLLCLSRPKGEQIYLTFFDQRKDVTDLRSLCPWLDDVPRDVCDQLLVNLDLAWQRCFKKLADRPCWKKKGRDQVNVTEPHPKMFRVEGQTVVFPKVGAISAVFHRPLVGTPKRCTISRDGDAWFVSILCEQVVADPAPSTKPPVALDLGVVNIIADSNGILVEAPRPLKKALKQLARAQRTVSKRKKGSKNRQKARNRVARIHRTVRRQRDHALHTVSKTYAKNHGTVIVEALGVENMTASASGTVEKPGTNVTQKTGLNRGILDAGWRKFLQMLTYKVIPEGGRVLQVPPAYSSQTCAECGVIDAKSRQSQSRFVCTSCGHVAHADVNAAKILLGRGLHALAVEATATACGGALMAGPKKQERRPVKVATRLRTFRSKVNPTDAQIVPKSG